MASIGTSANKPNFNSRFLLAVLSLSLLIYVCLLQLDMGFSPTEHHQVAYSALSMDEAFSDVLPAPSCSAQEKGYRSVFCPVWPHDKLPPDDQRKVFPAQGDLPPEISPIVRYLYGVQNPEDCSKANYYSKDYYPDVGEYTGNQVIILVSS